MIKGISHLGFAVKDLEKAMDFYRNKLSLEVGSPVEGGGLKVSMVKVGDAHIELLQPSAPEGPVAKFLEKRGEGIQHICLEVDDIEKELESLSAKGVELIDKQPREGVEGLIAFLHPRMTQGVLVELVQKKKE